jgi:hypothetical protein
VEKATNEETKSSLASAPLPVDPTDTKRLSGSSSHSGDHSDSTGGTGHSSDVELDASKAPQILVSSTVSQALTISFQINTEQRPDTLLQGQGDHITSYTLIIQALLASADTSLRQAIGSMRKLGEAVLQEEALEAFKAIKEPETHTHNLRTQIIALLEKNDVLKTSVSLINSELKHAKISLLTNYLAALATHLLTSLQQQELTTVFSKGRKNKEGSEGPDAKLAARALVAFNQLCAWSRAPDTELDEKTVSRIMVSLSSKKRDDVSDAEENHVLRYGISALKGGDGQKTDEGARADKLKQVLQKAKSDPMQVKTALIEIRDELAGNVSKVAAFVGDLYDYRRVLEFDLDDAFPLPKDLAKQGKTPRAYWEMQLAEYFDEDDHDFDFKKNAVTITRTNTEQLAQTIHRHFTMIAAAFPALVTHIGLEKLTDLFIQKTVLENQGWQEHPYEESYFNLAALKVELDQLDMNKPGEPTAVLPKSNAGHTPV